MALTYTMNTYKMRRSVLFTIFAMAAFALAACSGSTEVKPTVSTSSTPAASPAQSVSPAPAASVAPAADAGKGKVEALVGRWNGPEGSYLDVSKKGDKYSIEIKGLDAAKTFEGTAKGDVIEFSRNGKTETIKAATGAETGMKGFEKETNCVVVTKGSEGFCKK